MASLDYGTLQVGFNPIFVQVLMYYNIYFQQPPEGPKATGPDPFTRTYQLAQCPDKWVYVVADKDLTDMFASKFTSVEEALASMKAMGYQAVEVSTPVFAISTMFMKDGLDGKKNKNQGRSEGATRMCSFRAS